MALSSGSRLGPYEILGPLGAGGMGEVYRARDPRLAREVAIKVLPADRVADESRRRRFVQEARAASALNHPNIVTIHEIESSNGIDFIVMEYVPGQSLDGLIPKQGMRLGEALRIAISIADAVSAAHSRGIVHRDLKPANVIVGPDGMVKVLDFGLAKLVFDGASDEGETATAAGEAPLSQPGTIAGTAGYMSPEQATGGKVDARSDVFSFGAVLYEMATGRRAFAGGSTAETLAAVVRDQPKPPGEVAPSVPRDLEKLILRCLRKEPGKRFQHMVDAKVELEEIREESASGPAAAVQTRRKPWRRLAAAVGLLVALVAGVQLAYRPPPPPPRVVSITSTPGREGSPTFSPDGEQLAFKWDGEKSDNQDIYVTMIGSSEVHRLTTDPASDDWPAWSPDGRQIAFIRASAGGARAIHLVSPLGGSDRKLADLEALPARLSWSPDGRWLATAPQAYPLSDVPAGLQGVRLVGVPGGEIRVLTSPSAPTTHTQPTFSPDGGSLAYTSHDSFWASRVEMVALGPDYSLRGPPRRLTRRPMVMDAGLAWAPDGRSLVYGGGKPLRLWRVGVAGDQPAQVIEVAGYAAASPAVSAARGRLAFYRSHQRRNVYRFEAGRPLEAVTASSFEEDNPQFSPDGRRFAFSSTRNGESSEIWLAAADGSSPTQLTRGPGSFQGSPAWSPDGQKVAFDSYADDGYSDIWSIDADGGGLRRLTSNAADDNLPSWSRDGRFVYFISTRTGGKTVWRIPAAGGTEERMTEIGGGVAHEAIDGKTVLFTRARAQPSPLLSVPVGGRPERTIVDCARWQFAVVTAGIYYWGCGTDTRAVPVYLRDLATGRDRLVGNLESPLGGITVSPDGRTVLFPRSVGEGSDLMMIENFR